MLFNCNIFGNGSSGIVVFYLKHNWKEESPTDPNEEFKEILRKE